MAARRNRDRHWRRRGRFSGLYKLLSFLVILTALLVGCVVFFRVNQVTVEGNSRYTDAEIVAASGVELGDNLFLVNKPQTARSITRRLPYVEKVSPVRLLPDTLELRVVESRAAVVLEVDGVRWLLSRGGKLLEQGDRTLGEGLPLVAGLTPVTPAVGSPMAVAVEDQARLDTLKALLTALTDRDMMERTTEFIDLTSATTVYFGCDGALTVKVPMGGDMDGLVFRLQRTIETFQQRGEVVTGTLDLTYGDGKAHLLTERWLPDDYGRRTPGRAAEPTPQPSQPAVPREDGDG